MLKRYKPLSGGIDPARGDVVESRFECASLLQYTGSLAGHRNALVGLDKESGPLRDLLTVGGPAGLTNGCRLGSSDLYGKLKQLVDPCTVPAPGRSVKFEFN